MVETRIGFRRTQFPNQVDIEQIGPASREELCHLLEEAKKVMGKSSSVHTRVTVCLDDNGYDTLHPLLIDYGYD